MRIGGCKFTRLEILEVSGCSALTPAVVTEGAGEATLDSVTD